MKKLTITFADDAVLDMSTLIQHAIDLRLETIPNGAAPVKPKRIYIPGETAPGAIMKHFSPEAVFTKDKAELWITSVGFQKSGYGSALGRLRDTGHIRFLGNAKYQFVKPLEKNLK